MTTHLISLTVAGVSDCSVPHAVNPHRCAGGENIAHPEVPINLEVLPKSTRAQLIRENQTCRILMSAFLHWSVWLLTSSVPSRGEYKCLTSRGRRPI